MEAGAWLSAPRAAALVLSAGPGPAHCRAVEADARPPAPAARLARPGAADLAGTGCRRPPRLSLPRVGGGGCVPSGSPCPSRSESFPEPHGEHVPRTVGVAAGGGTSSSILAQQSAPCRSPGLDLLGEALPRPPSPCGPGARLCAAAVSALGVRACEPSRDGGRAQPAPLVLSVSCRRTRTRCGASSGRRRPGSGGTGGGGCGESPGVCGPCPERAHTPDLPGAAWALRQQAVHHGSPHVSQPLRAWGLEAAVSWTSARAGPRLAPLNPGPSPASFGVSPSRAAGTPFVSPPSHLPPRRLAFQAFH